jgi:L-threonylcarbamoyladenylate synthase
MADIISIAADEAGALERANAVLAAGGVIGLPTETVYGLAGDATSGAAVARIFEVKGRPRFNPLICHMADLAMAERHVEFDALSERLAAAFWPGPLTLVLPLRAGSGIHPLATAGLDTLAVRVPTGFSRRLIAHCDRPLAAPSANRSGRISPTSAAHVADDIGALIPLVLDGGPCTVGLESTIVKAGPDGLTLLRPGGLPAELIEDHIGGPLVRRAIPGAIEAPGMLASHYAPRAAVRIEAAAVEPGEVLVNFAGRKIAGAELARGVLDLSPAGDLRQAAANLFGTMQEADRIAASGSRAAIAFAPIPRHGLGEAINDRIARAAAPRP